LFSYARAGLVKSIGQLNRYIVCVRTTKRPIFEFIDAAIRPNDALQVFTLNDDYSFGILQSSIHWHWFTERCSTLTKRFRYTSDTVYDSFPFPQEPSLPKVTAVAAAAVELRRLRAKVMNQNGWSLRDLYRTLDLPGDNPLRNVQLGLDSAVRAAYGIEPGENDLEFLLNLNLQTSAFEEQGLPVVAPGLPPVVVDHSALITCDCITFSPL
jgi:hypothetical protein